MATVTATKPGRKTTGKKQPSSKNKSSKPVGRDAIRSAAKSAKANAGKPRGKAVASSTLPINDNVDSGGLDEAALDDALGDDNPLAGGLSGSNESEGPTSGEASTPSGKKHRRKRTVEVGGKFAANQPALDTMPKDVDERVPELTEVCQRILAAREKRRSLLEEVRDGLGEVGELLHANDLDLYIVSGVKFYEEPGQAEVKMKKVKQQ